MSKTESKIAKDEAPGIDVESEDFESLDSQEVREYKNTKRLDSMSSLLTPMPQLKKNVQVQFSSEAVNRISKAIIEKYSSELDIFINPESHPL